MKRSVSAAIVLLPILFPVSRLSAVTIRSGCFPQPVLIGINGDNPALIRQANAGWMRFTLRWTVVNPANGTWTWTQYDNEVNAARAQGLKILAILSTAPTWAGSNANGTLAPANISYWQQFVLRVAQRYNGMIDAYEIWNEPDLPDDGVGVGWAGSLTSYPTYTDYLHAAGQEIRAYAPGTLIAGPVTSSRPNSNTVLLFEQIQSSTYPDGPASNFVDVISFHANANDMETTLEIQSQIESQLNTLEVRNPSNRNKPVWITEFGWRSDPNGLTGQRDKIHTELGLMNGYVSSTPNVCVQETNCRLTNAFIFTQQDPPSSGIYTASGSPKPVVTDYLSTLPFPAREPDGETKPFSVSCAGRTCTFTSSVPLSTKIPGNFYYWDFGDGTDAFTTTTAVTHTFSNAGRYFVANGVTLDYYNNVNNKNQGEVRMNVGSDIEYVRIN